MKPAPFDYCRPELLEGALDALANCADDAKLLAGGQSLVPLLNFRLARPSLLVDIDRLPGLAYVEERNGTLAIGALTRHADVEASPVALRGLRLLVEAVKHIGHQAIRNRGTIGGSLAHADPASELGCVFLTTAGTVRVRSRDGERIIAAEEFFRGYFQTALEPVEIITEIQLPLPAPGAGWAFEELSRRHGDFALAMAAVQLELSADGRIARVVVGLAGVGPAPMRAREAEELLVGELPSPSALDAAALAIGRAVQPESDVHATAEDRRHLAAVLGRRALNHAALRAQVACA